MVHSALVSHCNELNSFPACIVKSKKGSSLFTRQKGNGTSTAQTSEPIDYFSFRLTLRGFELPVDTWALIRHGEAPPNVSTTPLCENGCHIAQNDLLIPLLQL